MLKRLQALKAYYLNEVYIWDIGCDHGKLGLSFINEARVKKIHLVDPSKEVFKKLKDTVKDSYITSGAVDIINKSGQKLKIETKSNLFFIAGMGGKEISEIILRHLPFLEKDSRIVISPHRKILELRELLHGLPLELEKEEVIWEKGQYYVIMSLNHNAQVKRKVSLFGEEIWKSKWGEDYRQHQIKHYSHHKDKKSMDYVNYLKFLGPFLSL